MASDVISPYITTKSLFFFLLLLFQTTAADKEHYNTTRDELFAAKIQSTGNRKPQTNNINTVHIPPRPPGRKRGRFGARRSPLMTGQDKIFNASEHEVPSGPNPISNR